MSTVQSYSASNFPGTPAAERDKKHAVQERAEFRQQLFETKKAEAMAAGATFGDACIQARAHVTAACDRPLPIKTP